MRPAVDEAQNKMHSTKFHLTNFTKAKNCIVYIVCAFTSYYTFFNQLSSSAMPLAKYTLSNLSELWFGKIIAANEHVLYKWQVKNSSLPYPPPLSFQKLGKNKNFHSYCLNDKTSKHT